MSTGYCSSCRSRVEFGERYCSYCGTAQPINMQHPAKPTPPTRVRFFWLKIIGGILVFGWAWTMLAFLTHPTKPSQAASPSPSPTATGTPKVDFDTLTAAQHLETARKLITPKANVDALSSAKAHLEAISKEATEYTTSRQLLVQIKPQLEKQINIAAAEFTQKVIEAAPLRVIKATWQKGGFGAVALWTVTFENRGKRPVGDITYRTAYYSETGHLVDKGGVDAALSASKIVQKVIPPKSKRTIEINDGFLHNSQAATANFELVGWRYVN